MRDQEQVQRVRRGIPSYTGHFFGDERNPEVRVHRRSRVAYAQCKACGRSVIALPGHGSVTGTALTSGCER